MNDEERLYLYQAALKLAIVRNSLTMRGIIENGYEFMQMINGIAEMLDKDEKEKKENCKDDQEGNT